MKVKPLKKPAKVILYAGLTMSLLMFLIKIILTFMFGKLVYTYLNYILLSQAALENALAFLVLAIVGSLSIDIMMKRQSN